MNRMNVCISLNKGILIISVAYLLNFIYFVQSNDVDDKLLDDRPTSHAESKFVKSSKILALRTNTEKNNDNEHTTLGIIYNLINTVHTFISAWWYNSMYAPDNMEECIQNNATSVSSSATTNIVTLPPYVSQSLPRLPIKDDLNIDLPQGVKDSIVELFASKLNHPVISNDLVKFEQPKPLSTGGTGLSKSIFGRILGYIWDKAVALFGKNKKGKKDNNKSRGGILDSLVNFLRGDYFIKDSSAADIRMNVDPFLEKLQRLNWFYNEWRRFDTAKHNDKKYFGTDDEYVTVLVDRLVHFNGF